MFLTKRSKFSELQLVCKRAKISDFFYTLYNSALVLLFYLFCKKHLKAFIDSCCLSSGDKLFHVLIFAYLYIKE